MSSDQQSNYWKPTSDDETSAKSTTAPVADSVTTNSEPASVSDSPAQPSPVSEEAITWHASEYIHHDRDTMWYIWVAVVTAVFLYVAIFLMKSVTFSVLVLVMAISVIVLARRPLRTLKYTLSPKGLYVMGQLHSLEHFKSFGIVRDEGELSVVLIPTQRFSPAITVYFPAQLGERIVDFLGKRLPMQELQLDIVDRLVRKLRL